jgi:hypothetical protein
LISARLASIELVDAAIANTSCNRYPHHETTCIRQKSEVLRWSTYSYCAYILLLITILQAYRIIGVVSCLLTCSYFSEDYSIISEGEQLWYARDEYENNQDHNVNYE